MQTDVLLFCGMTAAHSLFGLDLLLQVFFLLFPHFRPLLSCFLSDLYRSLRSIAGPRALEHLVDTVLYFDAPMQTESGDLRSEMAYVP